MPCHPTPRGTFKLLSPDASDCNFPETFRNMSDLDPDAQRDCCPPIHLTKARKRVRGVSLNNIEKENETEDDRIGNNNGNGDHKNQGSGISVLKVCRRGEASALSTTRYLYPLS